MIAISTIAWFIASLLMMGFFAGIEMAFYSVNRFGIELRKKQGRYDAVLLSRYFESPELFLSTMLIGFTLFLVCFALLFVNITDTIWNAIGLYYQGVRITLNIILAAFFVLILGEFVPRAIFRAHSNLLLTRLVFLINILYQVLLPIARVFMPWRSGRSNTFST